MMPIGKGNDNKMLGNTRIETDLRFLEALAGITRTTRSLYGPMKNRKQVIVGEDEQEVIFTNDAFTIVKSLKSEHAVYALLTSIMEDHMRAFGTGSTTLMNLVGVLVECALKLRHEQVTIDDISDGFMEADTIVRMTCRRMILNLYEDIFPSKLSMPFKLQENPQQRVEQLEILGECLQTEDYHDLKEPLEDEEEDDKNSSSNNSSTIASLVLPMRLAVDAASQLEVKVFTERPLLRSVDFHVFLASSAMDSIVLPGELIKLPVEQHGPMRRLFQSVRSCTASRNQPKFIQGIAVIDGDLMVPANYARNQFLSDVVAYLGRNTRLVACNGEIDSLLVDFLMETQGIGCIHVRTEDQLRRIALLAGATILSSVYEIEEEQDVGRNPVLLELVQVDGIDVKAYQEGDLDAVDPIHLRGHQIDGGLDKQHLFLHLYCCPATTSTENETELEAMTTIGCNSNVSLILCGKTASQAQELLVRVQNYLFRLKNTIKDGSLIPGNGSFLGASAAELLYQAEQNKNDVKSIVLQQVAEALTGLCAALMSNCGFEYILSLDRAMKVRQAYEQGIRDYGGQDQFYQMCHFRGDYAVLTNQNNNNSQRRKTRQKKGQMECYTSLLHVIACAFRFVTLLLRTDMMLINQPMQYTSAGASEE